jgi:hypothetical protein
MPRTRLTAAVCDSVALVEILLNEVDNPLLTTDEACVCADVASVVVAADDPQLFNEKTAAVKKAV